MPEKKILAKKNQFFGKTNRVFWLVSIRWNNSKIVNQNTKFLRPAQLSQKIQMQPMIQLSIMRCRWSKRHHNRWAGVDSFQQKNKKNYTVHIQTNKICQILTQQHNSLKYSHLSYMNLEFHTLVLNLSRIKKVVLFKSTRYFEIYIHYWII